MAGGADVARGARGVDGGAAEGAVQRIITKMAKMPVASIACDAGGGMWYLGPVRWVVRVELVRRITAEDLCLRSSILERKTTVIKF